MRLVVDLTRCQGYGQCAFLAADVFRMRGNEALIDDRQPDEGQGERVQRGAATCPVQDIRVDRIASRDAAPAVSAPAVAATVPAQGTSPRTLAAEVEAFRRTGSLTIIGGEPYQPYDRPPLPKQLLGESIPPDHTGLRLLDVVGAPWMLGTPAAGLDLTGRPGRVTDGGAHPLRVGQDGSAPPDAQWSWPSRGPVRRSRS